MIPTLPPRRSLALLAVLALAMVVLSYAVILLIAAASVGLPILLIMSSRSPGSQTLVLLVCGVLMAATMLWSLVPRRDRFEEPGPRLDRSSNPRLFAQLDSIAAALNEPLPTEVFLVPQVNAFVTDRGGIMGFGSRRVMGIGLPLMAVLKVSEFRAVLAHEFAHYYSGDTRLGPFVYKTRQAMIRTIQNMASIGGVMRIALAAIVYRLVMAILQAYWKAFFKGTQLISRRQEYRADELACHIAGSEALISGLKKIHIADGAFPAYWNFEVAPFLGNGYRLPIAEGLGLFINAPDVSHQIEEYLQKELKESNSNPYDSHPPLRDRIAAAHKLPAQDSPCSDTPALTLFSDLLQEEARILSMLNSEQQVAALKVLGWNELPSVLPGLWNDTVKTNAHLLVDLTAENVPDIVEKLPEIGSQIPDPKGMLLTPEERTGRAADLIGTALALAMVSAGWRFHASPGERYYEVGSEHFSLREFLGNLLANRISREQWVERCRALKIASVPLAGGSASQIKLSQNALSAE